MVLPSNHFSLVMLMTFIGAIALGLGAMRVGSPIAIGVTLAVAEVALLTGLLGAIVRRGDGAWVGFALFGSTYFVPVVLLAFESNLVVRVNPSESLVEWLVGTLHAWPGPPRAVPAFNGRFLQAYSGGQPIDPRSLENAQRFPDIFGLLSADERTQFDDYVGYFKGYQAGITTFQENKARARVIGHASFALLFGMLGAILGRTLERPRVSIEPRRIGRGQPSELILDANPRS